MEFIIILNPKTSNNAIVLDDNGFIETYSDYYDAKVYTELLKENGDCRCYGIFALCSDERNYLT